MAGIFAFRCRLCGKIHEGLPSFEFIAPDQYASLTNNQKKEFGQLSQNFCIITHASGTDRFIRAVIEIEIHGMREPLTLSVWVSLSADNFDIYANRSGNSIPSKGFFGWVCNDISFYPYPFPRPADIMVNANDAPPKVVLHRGDPEDDPLVNDQVSGISISKAQEFAAIAIHGTAPEIRSSDAT